jgi:hypothetical protein
VRARVLYPLLGRWLTRDPAGYVDDVSQYSYARAKPIGTSDYLGLGIWPGIITYPRRDTPPDDSIRVKCVNIPPLPYSHCWIERHGRVCGGVATCQWPVEPPCHGSQWGPIWTYCVPWEDSPESGLVEKNKDRGTDLFHTVRTTRVTCPPGTDMDAVWRCVEDTIRRIDECRIRYDPLGPNGNTVIRFIVLHCLRSHGCRLWADPPNSVADPLGWDSEEGLRQLEECVVHD